MAVAVDLHAQYCPNLNPNSCNMGDLINHFSTSLGTTNISNLNSGCSVGAYSYISNQKIITSPGAFYEIMIQSDQLPQSFACWIDWNKNFDFSDTLEDVWNSVTNSSNPFYGTIIVPGNVPYGKDYRMRLRSSWSTPPTSPCLWNVWGEIEDYNVWVLAQYPHDAGIVSINSPNVNTCNIGNTVPISIELENMGNDTLYSCTIDWWVNSVQQTPYSWTGTIAPYSSLNTPNFATYNFLPFDTLKIITSYPNGQKDIMSF